MSRVVLIAPDTVFERQAELLVGGDVLTMAPGPPDALLTRILRLEVWPQIIVFGAHMPPEDVYAVASVARRTVTTLALITPDGELPVEAVEAGILEAVRSDADLDDVDALFVRAGERAARARATLQAPRDRLTGGRVIVVTSPKGGVGKTTVSTNIAVGLAADDPFEVVLVDLDLQFGDVATALDLEAPRSIVDAITPAAGRDRLLVRTALTSHPSGLLVLAAPESPAAGDRVDPSRIGQLVRQLSREFRYVVVDSGPGLSAHTLAALEEATDVVAVTSSDITSVRALAKELQLIAELELVQSPPFIVLNLADRRGVRVRDIEATLKATVDLVIPRSRAVINSTNRGVPVILDSPRTAAAARLRDLIRRLDPARGRRRRDTAQRREQ